MSGLLLQHVDNLETSSRLVVRQVVDIPIAFKIDLGLELLRSRQGKQGTYMNPKNGPNGLDRMKLRFVCEILRVGGTIFKARGRRTTGG